MASGPTSARPWDTGHMKRPPYEVPPIEALGACGICQLARLTAGVSAWPFQRVAPVSAWHP